MKISIPSFERTRPYGVDANLLEPLPFRVRLVESTQDLLAAVEIRSSAYERHVPAVGIALREPEPDDHREDILLLLAERKLDGQPIGSMRLQPNFNRPLRVEGEVSLPDRFRGRRLVEGMRLGVQNGLSGRLVMLALVKASYELCHASDIDFVVVAGRRSVSAIYRSMYFDDILEGRTIPLSYADNLPHSVFAMPIMDADRRWQTGGHALYDFMARTEHPDIDVDYETVQRTFGRA